jgi:hypothetical protein
MFSHLNLIYCLTIKKTSIILSCFLKNTNTNLLNILSKLNIKILSKLNIKFRP